MMLTWRIALLILFVTGCSGGRSPLPEIDREIRGRPIAILPANSIPSTLVADSGSVELVVQQRIGDAASLTVRGRWRARSPGDNPLADGEGPVRSAMARAGIAVKSLTVQDGAVAIEGTVCAARTGSGWEIERLGTPWTPRTDSGPVGWRRVRTGSASFPAHDADAELTAELVGDLDADGDDDFVVAGWAGSPAVLWYRRWACGWTAHPIEAGTLPVEAGGALGDIDGDGDLDLVLGATFTSPELWWWENPLPHGDPARPWRRSTIRASGANTLHDQIFADVDGDGRSELFSWNQRARALLMFRIPTDSAALRQPWPETKIFEWSGEEEMEGLAAADLNGDGRTDLVGGGRWFEHVAADSFRAHPIDETLRQVRAATGRFLRSGGVQVVFGPGDADLPLRWYERRDTAWVGHTLVARVVHGHSLSVGDVDGDGLDDIYLAEMARWSSPDLPLDNPGARTWIFYSRGDGTFNAQLVRTGTGTHEGKLADADGDGRLDIVAKSFRDRGPRVDVLFSTGPRSGTLPLDRWERVVIDEDRPGKAVFVVPADLDGDGRPEILAGRWAYRRLGSGTDRWERRALGGALRNVALAADLDRDGYLDVFGTGSDDDPPADPSLVWLRGGRSDRLSPGPMLPPGSGDFLQGAAVLGSGGSRVDVALSWHAAGSGVEMLRSPRDSGGAWSLDRLSTEGQDEQLTAADLDGDGCDDLVLGTRLLRRGPSGWTAEIIDSSGERPDRNRVGDIDGDGRPDVVVGFEAISKPGWLRWYSRDPEGRWVGHDIERITGPMSLDLGDLDGDGDLDVVAGEHDLVHPETARLLIFENLDHGRRWRRIEVSRGDEHHDGAQLVDIDGDGDPDIVSVGWSHSRVLLYRNLAIP